MFHSVTFRVTEGKERENTVETTIEEMMPENFTNPMKDTQPKIQKTKRIPSRI